MSTILYLSLHGISYQAYWQPITNYNYFITYLSEVIPLLNSSIVPNTVDYLPIYILICQYKNLCSGLRILLLLAGGFNYNITGPLTSYIMNYDFSIGLSSSHLMTTIYLTRTGS